MPRFAFVLKKSPKNVNQISGKVEFTSRERDILACLIEGISSRKIASILAIAPKTVRNHIYNITEKLGCHSRTATIEYIKNSSNFSEFRNHYLFLSMEADFRDKLSQIKKLRVTVPYVQYVGNTQNEIITKLQNHLEYSGIETWDPMLSVKNHTDYIVAPIPEYDNDYIKNFIYTHKKEKIIFITQSDDNIEIPEAKNVYYIKNSNYFLLTLELIQKIYSDINLKKIILDFKGHWDANLNFNQDKYEENSYHEPLLIKPRCFCWQFLSLFMFLIIAFLLCFYKKTTVHSHYVCSDVVIPTENHFLKRSRLLESIDQKFREQNGIRTVGLVGIGGSGKTILARQYAKDQKFSLIWELNAQTPVTLLGSYFDLAETLTENETEQKKIASIKTLEDYKERHIKILAFLQEKLKDHKKWLLIFDHAESLADIRKYFPCDEMLWGQGYILVTSQDSQIGNAGCIKPEHVIPVDPLTEEEMMTLFSNIIDKKNMTNLEKKDAQFFLNQLPPFPLDVSTAAYYIKDTKISFKDYIKQMKSYDQSFNIVQKTVLHSVNDYVLTRHDIWQNAFRKILEQHVDFKDLMICITLFDGQCIPKSFLEHYKKKSVVDLFLHVLKTHSIITYESLYANEPLFSIHASTQAGFLNFIQNDFKKELCNNISVIIENLDSYTNHILDNADINYLRLFIHHISNILKNEHIMTNKSLAYLYKILGKLYQKIGQIDKSSEFLQKTNNTLPTSQSLQPK